MMDELISEVCTKTGLSQDQARSAVNAVIGVLKTRLPAPLASCLDGVAGGSASVVADGGGVETKREPKRRHCERSHRTAGKFVRQQEMKRTNGQKEPENARKLMLCFALAGMTLIPGTLPAFQSKSEAKTTTAAPATGAPSDKEIADAKAKGLVWVNTSSKGLSQRRPVLRQDETGQVHDGGRRSERRRS